MASLIHMPAWVLKELSSLAFSTSSNSLVFGSSSCHLCSSVSNTSTEICDQYLLSENIVSPHCVKKFAPTFGVLH